MEKNWKVGRLKDHLGSLFLFMLGMVYLNLRTCWCMNEEGLALLRFRDRIEKDPFGALRSWDEDDGEVDHCSWYGVECAGGKVVALNLKDLCLEGTLAPELGNMIHIKAIILRNNSFSGVIPYEIGELKELEVMDLGYNNFTGPLPYNFGNNLSLASLLLDNNDLLTGLSPEIHEFEMTSQAQQDENVLLSSKRLSCHMKSVSRNEDLTKHAFHQRVLAASPSLSNIIVPAGQPSKKSLLESSSAPTVAGGGPNLDPSTKLASPAPASSSSPAPAPAPASAPASAPAPAPALAPPVASPTIPPAPPSVNTASGPNASQKSNEDTPLIVGVVVGVSALLFLVALGIYWYRRSKIITIKPWATGLSGQLQKAFVTGVPKLKRSELETACEDFSNVVGASSIGTIYKGTLSSGVEIAVASIAIKSADDWSKNLEAHFRKKIETLSKINHKNFVNLIGYCEEEEPFTRMLVFEYAPNGTLFEHLHIKEAEHLDWGMRLRIAMGMAYCLEYMHQLNPPIPHKNLNSSAITLTEDYAAKISEFNFWIQISAADIESKGIELIETSTMGSERNIYSFGVVLFEMVTARLPYSVDNGSLDDWASDYVRGDKPLRHIVDPTLRSFDVNQVEEIGQVIKYCVHPDPKHRPTMREVCKMLRGITGIPHDGAAPKISPLWWAELEVLSTDGN